MKRRAHTQNPKNETETKTEERGDPNHERAPQPFAANQGSIFTGEKLDVVGDIEYAIGI